MSDRKHLRVYIPRIIGGILAALAIFYLVKIINKFIDEKPVKHDKKIQAITLLKPPPPPPPPPKVEKPPEPEVKEKIKELEPEPDPEPEQKPDEPPPDAEPPGPQGVDAPIGAGGTLLAGKGGGGGRGGNPYAWYGSLVKNDIVRQLSNHDELRRKAYAAIVKIWLKPDGSIERVELANGSNDAEIDKILSRLLNKLDKINEPLPPGLPQPIKLKISSRI
jgi:protein TonB